MRARTQRVHLGIGTLIWTGAVLAVGLASGQATEESVTEQHEKELHAMAGAQISTACTSCHDLEHHTHRVGPHLVQVMGRKAGQTGGYEYSDAMRDSGIVWDEAALRRFLTSPQKMVPGTKMGLSGMSESDISALIEYIKELQ